METSGRIRSVCATAPLSRRTVLRGLGTALALPFLEAMAPARTRPRPARLVYLYVPNGVHMPDWTPAAEGTDFALPWILEPLAPFRERLGVLSGLTHDKARPNGDGPGDHARAAAVFLTGVQPLKTDGQVKLARSADQIAAAAVGGATRFRSLELGLERGRDSGQCDSGYACAYSNNISWQSGTAPASKETNPRALFDRLFRGGGADPAVEAERRARRRSVLDFVRGDAARLRSRLGARDRAKLDEYESGLRELERRIARAEDECVAEVPDALRPAASPRQYGEHARLLLELLALALELDLTRVATFLYANEGSDRSYEEIGVSEGHHGLSHHGGDAKKQEQIRRINRLHVELTAGFLAKLAAASDGAGDLLETTHVVHGAAIGDGNRHNHDDLPIVVAGGSGRRVPLGRHQRFPKETPLCDLHVTLLEELGVRVDALGDARGALEFD